MKPCKMTCSILGGDKELSCKEKRSRRGDGGEGGERGKGRVSQEERNVREEWARERASAVKGKEREERINVSKNDKAERRRARE